MARNEQKYKLKVAWRLLPHYLVSYSKPQKFTTIFLSCIISILLTSLDDQNLEKQPTKPPIFSSYFVRVTSTEKPMFEK